jgi:hypothetical protein
MPREALAAESSGESVAPPESDRAKAVWVGRLCERFGGEDVGFEERRPARCLKPPADGKAARDDEVAKALLRFNLAAAADVPMRAARPARY